MVGNGLGEGRTELGSKSMLIREEAEGSATLGGTLTGRLVDGGFSGVRLGVLDIDGGSYENVNIGGLLEGGGSVVGRGRDEGKTVGTRDEDGGTSVVEDGGTSGIDMYVGRGLLVAEGVGIGGSLGEGGSSLVTVTGWGF